MGSATNIDNTSLSSPPGRLIRMLLIDDHPIVRHGLRQILEAEEDIEVVGELDRIDPIADVLTRLAPDIVLLDLDLGQLRGVQALEALRAVDPEQRVIIYTSHDEENYIIGSARLGVDGYLLKSSSRKDLVGAVRQVATGGTAIESIVAKKLMKHMNRTKSDAIHPLDEISQREKQVLSHLATGLSNRDIANSLCISESTVKFHVHAILSKLDANNRTEAVSKAVKFGIISFDTTVDKHH